MPTISKWIALFQIFKSSWQSTLNISFWNLLKIVFSAPANFKMLLYSGDADTMVNWLGAEIFTANNFAALGLTVFFLNILFF